MAICVVELPQSVVRRIGGARVFLHIPDKSIFDRGRPIETGSTR
jgi:hypothetical protein